MDHSGVVCSEEPQGREVPHFINSHQTSMGWVYLIAIAKWDDAGVWLQAFLKKCDVLVYCVFTGQFGQTQPMGSHGSTQLICCFAGLIVQGPQTREPSKVVCNRKSSIQKELQTELMLSPDRTDSLENKGQPVHLVGKLR